MRLSVFVIALGAWLLSAPVSATPLTVSELATLQETDAGPKNPTPSKAAIELARKIGREGNDDGLRAIIELHQVVLLNSAIASYSLSSSRSLPRSLEALIVAHYNDPDLQRPLLFTIGRGLDQEGRRIPQYHSRALFDLLYADMQNHRKTRVDDFGRAILIVATDLKGIEPELLSVLPSVPREAQAELVTFLGQRHYAPAVRALRDLQEHTPFARDMNGLLGRIDLSLLSIGTPDAVKAVLDRLAELRESNDVQARSEIVYIVDTLRTHGSRSQPHYLALRALLPKELSPDVQGAVVRLIASRKETDGVPELISATGHGNDEALTALLTLGDQQAWKAAATQLEQAGSSAAIKPERLASLRNRLDAAIANPERAKAEVNEAERKQALNEAWRRLNEEIPKEAPLRASDPKRYVSEAENRLQRAKALLEANAGLPETTKYRGDILQAYVRLATFTRFTVRDAAHAVALYEHAAAVSKDLPSFENPGRWALIGVADCLRFDLKDSRRALQTYKEVLQHEEHEQPSTNDVEAAWQRLFAEWLNAEIAFLSEGKRYAGTPNADDSGILAYVLIYGGKDLQEDDSALSALTTALKTRTPAAPESRDFAPQLEALSPSEARLFSAFYLLPLMRSPERVVHFLRKSDPAGFLTAHFFAAWHLLDQAVAGDDRKKAVGAPDGGVLAWSASDADLMHRAEVALGVHATIVIAPDSSLSSPETTWQTFLGALRRADLDAVWKCMTPGLRNRFEASLRAMTPAQLEQMAESLVDFKRMGEYGDFVEAVVVRSGGAAGTVTFVRQGPEWRISEM
jgi:hypothetical protein